MSTKKNNIAISIVSHGHGEILLRSLECLSRSLAPNFAQQVTIIITFNISEKHILDRSAIFFDSNFFIIENQTPKGFGDNHNSAYSFLKKKISFDWFLVMNPDLYFPEDSTELWIDLLEDNFDQSIALVCPTQTNQMGHIEDFTRVLPSPYALFCRYLIKFFPNTQSHFTTLKYFDWVNGACMIFRDNFFQKLSGFNTHFFMYCEDADICLRLQNFGGKIFIHNHKVIHDAQRNSRNRISHIYWHIISLLKLWTSSSYWIYFFNKLK